MRRSLHPTLLLLSLLLGGHAAAQVEIPEVDPDLLDRVSQLSPCWAEDSFSHEAWLTVTTLALDEFGADCRERLPETDHPLCDVAVAEVIGVGVDHGHGCLFDRAGNLATAHYVLGTRLLDEGDYRQGELELFVAQQALPADAAVLRAWTDAIGQQLRSLALQRPLTDEYALDVQTLTTAALRFYPDDWELSRRRAWARQAAHPDRVEGEFARCQQAVQDHRWEAADAACATVLALEPWHPQAQEMQTYIAVQQDREARVGALGRWVLGALALAVGLALVVLLQGDLFLALGKSQLARAAFTYLATIMPAWKRPFLQMARIHKREANAHEERAVLEQARSQWPREPEVLQRLFEYYSRVGDMQGVRDILLQLDAVRNLSPDQLVSLLEAQQTLGLVEEDLYTTLARSVGSDPDTPLLPLLALGHAQRARADDEARSVYERTLALPDPRLRFMVQLARMELAAGNAGKAIEFAEQAVAEHPTAEAVDCLTDALLETDLEEHIIWASPPSGGILFLYPALLKVAEQRPDLAPMIADRLKEFYEETDEPQVGVITSAVVDMLEDRDCREQLLASADAVDESVPYLKAVEAAFEEYARRNPADGFLWLALTGIHRKLGRHTLALTALERASHIPDTRSFASRYAASLVQDLDTVGVVELLAASLGLQARPLQQTRDGLVELIFVHPAAPLSGWWKELDHARVRVYLNRAPSPEDVLDFRRSMEDRDGTARGLAVLVSAARPSAGTTELIMTSMIEQPRLHMLPLDERTLRDAVADFRTRAMLTQLRSQWLLGEDLFDKKDPVLDAAEFFGRGQVLRTLVRKVHRGEVFGVFGIRKMGKTSLAHRLRTHLSDSVVAMVDLQEVASSSCLSLAQLLCDRALEDWAAKFPHVEGPELTPLPDDPAGAMVAFEGNLRTLRAAILETSSITTLFFLIDEIEHLIPHELDGGNFHDGFTHYDTFFRLLRGLHQTDFRDVFGFAVVGADARLCLQGRWGGRDNPIFQYLSELFVGPLSTSETAEMVTNLGAGMGLGFTDDALVTLYDLSGGHPMVCRQLCSETAKVAGDQRPVTINAQTVRVAAESYLTLKKGYFGEILSFYLNSFQRGILDAVAADEDGAITRTELQQRTSRLFDDPDRFDRELQNLEQFSLLDRRGDQYRFTMRLLRTYIRVRRLDIEA